LRRPASARRSCHDAEVDELTVNLVVKILIWQTSPVTSLRHIFLVSLGAWCGHVVASPSDVPWTDVIRGDGLKP